MFFSKVHALFEDSDERVDVVCLMLYFDGKVDVIVGWLKAYLD